MFFMSETVFSIAIFRIEIATIRFIALAGTSQLYHTRRTRISACTLFRQTVKLPGGIYVRICVARREQTQRKSALRRSPSVFPYSIICVAFVRNQ
jgi:hypothetical protein